MAVGMVRASREADRSERIADFLQSLLVSTNPDEALAAGVDVGKVLITAREIFGGDHATVAAVLSSRAVQLQTSGDLEGAEKLYRQSLRLWREQMGEDDPNVALVLSRLGILAVTKGDNQAAEAALRESLRIARAQPGEETLAICDTMNGLAGLIFNRGEFDEAESLFKESISIRQRLAPQQRLQIAVTMSSLINAMAMAGKDTEAGAMITEYIESWRAALPADSTFMARVLTDIGVRWHVGHGDYDAARPLLVEAVEIFRAHDEPVSQGRAMAVRGLFRVREKTGDVLGALALGGELLEVTRMFEGGGRLDDAVKDLATVTWQIARDSGLPDDQYLLARNTIELCLERKPDTAAYTNTLGILRYRLGDYVGALKTLAVSHEFYSQQHEGGVPADLAFMAMAQYRLGDQAEARVMMTLLQAAMTNPELAASEDNRKHLAEAEALLGADQ